MPDYYRKKTVVNTWNHTLEGYLTRGSFTEDPKKNALYISDPNPDLCQGVGRRKKKRIRNNMDESEAGPAVILCSKCDNFGHSYKRCTAAYYAANVSGAVASQTSTARSNNGGGRGRDRGRGRSNNARFL